MNSNLLYFSLLKIVCVLPPLLLMVAYAVLVERKVADRFAKCGLGPVGVEVR